MAVSLFCEFRSSSQWKSLATPTVCQTVCYTLRSHILSLHEHTLWYIIRAYTLFQTYTIRQLDLMPKSWNELLRHWRSVFLFLVCVANIKSCKRARPTLGGYRMRTVDEIVRGQWQLISVLSLCRQIAIHNSWLRPEINGTGTDQDAAHPVLFMHDVNAGFLLLS